MVEEMDFGFFGFADFDLVENIKKDFESKPNLSIFKNENWNFWFKDSNQTILKSKPTIIWISNKELGSRRIEFDSGFSIRGKV
jgi:hypothetical protein